MRVGVQVEEKSSVVRQPFKFLIVFVEVPNPKLITAKVTDPTGKVLPIEYAPQYSSGNIEILLTPENQGTHKIHLFYEGSPISGTSPFQTNPEPYACIIGEQERNDAYPGDEYLVQMTAIASKIADFKFALKGPASHGAKGAPTVVASLGLDPQKDQGIRVKFNKDNQPVNPNGTENGVWDIRFMTKFSGQYSLLVFHNSKPVQGCPVNINSAIENSRAFGQGPQKVLLCSEVEQEEKVGVTSPRNPKTVSPQQSSGGPVQITSNKASSGPVQITASKPSSGGPVQINATSSKPVEIKASTPKAEPQVDKISRSTSRDKSSDKVHRSHSKKSGGDHTHKSSRPEKK